MRWRGPYFRRLQTRLVASVLLLLLAVQLAGYAAISTAIQSTARKHAQSELAVGERVFRRLLAQRGQRLAQAAQVLAGDFAFRDAIATHDGETVGSALKNHGDRIRADIVMLVDLEGRLVADTVGLRGSTPFAVTRLVEEIERGGDGTGIALVGGRAYQLVAAPVRAPLTISWVAMGFLVDDELAKDLGSLTALAVSIASEETRDGWQMRASTLDEQNRGTVAASLPALAGRATEGAPLALADGEYETRVAQIGTLDRTRIAAVLQRSLADAAAPFRSLQTALLVLTAIGIVLSLFGSTLMARRITGPVSALAAAARKIEEGDYSQAVDVRTADEIGDLAAAFKHMSEGIAARERRITELAYSDPLTGLPNRALFNDRIKQAVSAARRASSKLSVLQMDLDRFKYVNDTLGHQIGDLLLREVAQRLSQALQRRGDTVARVGGDEFAVLLPTEDPDGAILVARRLLEALAEPITIEGQLVDVGASIGVANFPQHGEDANTLVRHADVAMYAAKRTGTGVEVYDPRHDENTPERLSLMAELRRAVEHDELTLVYQPKMDLTGRGVHCAEALIRWDHPERGFVSPDKFIPFAEQTGYIKAITRWVLGKAVAQCAAWSARGLELSVSINISARDLHSSDFPRHVIEVLAAHGVEPGRLWLEVTESAVMDDPTHALDVLERLSKLGVRLSIDDFGTGHSSLAYLKKLPVDELKIDKSFVLGLTRDKDDATIVRSTIDLAHNMGLTVAAEGVEDGDVLRALKRLGCDLAQGYYISRPLAPAEFEHWMTGVRADRGQTTERRVH
jgi:diguanylate cyclase (GGDEF)-like protein